MDTGKDQAPIERVPRALDDGEVREAQQEALVILAQRFRITPLGQVFTDERFTGTRVYNTGLSRDYTATRISNDLGDEITLKALIKKSDRSKGDYIGDEIRIKRPSSLAGTGPVFEHVIYQRDGIRRTADANTDINRDSGLSVVRRIGRIK